MRHRAAVSAAAAAAAAVDGGAAATAAAVDGGAAAAATAAAGACKARNFAHRGDDDDATETPAVPPGLQTVRGPDIYRDADGNCYNQDLKQINEKFGVVHARGSRGGKRTRPEHKVSYSVDHRPWVFDPVTGMRERPQEARSSWDRWPTEAAADATEAAAVLGM